MDLIKSINSDKNMYVVRFYLCIYGHIQEGNRIKFILCLISVVHSGQVYFANKRYHCWSRTATLSVLICAIGLEQEV